MDNLDMFMGESAETATPEEKLHSHVCNKGDVKATTEGIIIPWALLRRLFAHKVTTKSGKEIMAYLTVPRGKVAVNGKELNKFRMGVGCYLKP